jgi:cytochrome c oxidase subunit 2
MICQINSLSKNTVEVKCMKFFHKFWLLFGLGLLMSGCTASPTFLNPASLISGHEAALYREILTETVLIFILIIGAFIWIFIRDRDRGGKKIIPPQMYGKLAWAAIPLLAIVFLDGGDFVLMAKTMFAVAPPAAASQDIQLHVIGHRWWWEFDYKGQNIKTANELHIPVGATVQITLDSVDVIHSFWVPQLTGKTDVIPGQTNHMWITSDRVGEFLGQCTEFCGTEHAMMRIKTIVQSQADFDAWVANQQKAASQPQTPQEQAGYTTVTTVCASCHSLNPAEPDNKTGPNLTHLFSRSIFAGGTYDLNDANLRNWLKDTQAMKPGNDMNVTLSPTQIDQLAAYLELLK